MNSRQIILEVKNLTKTYFSGKKPVYALNDVSIEVKQGETIGIVGESGCGKTTLGRCIARGIEASSGQILLHTEDGGVVDFLQLKGAMLRNYRREIQMIFQDPYASLDPRMTVFDIISEPLTYKSGYTKDEIKKAVDDIAGKVGLNKNLLRRYPHAFSGGQRQRIGIARSLILQPKLIVCDEAVSALDVSIQAQIINLLKELRDEYGLTYIFISHSLSVVRYISDKVIVMYLGRIVEMSETDSLFVNPLHPYTQALLSAAPQPDPDYKVNRIMLNGEVPNPSNPPLGCHFHPRCRYKTAKCTYDVPPLEDVGGRLVACWNYKNLQKA
ncbi:oligopeptide/dipeptide ABC transporter ATP-binding protein [uncultured Sphaerochaeta sp.]|uniref:ABC transporter ATP-binding protein n=1 Tax=uncultured Sphaerochaeta sp. TaxID=886478 RepID=UPI002A0A9FEF|nr:oligopeptide/dipeptide ABC transporter ATP-binding protein [uncultured Sphaerochaeta sp.]